VILAKLLGSVLRQTPRVESHDRATPLLEQGVAALRRGDADAAERAFHAAISVQSENARIHQRIAEAYMGAGLRTPARHHVERWIALDPRSPAAHSLLGTLHQLIGNVEESEKCYRNAIALDADEMPAHYNLAVLLRKHGHTPEALRHFDAAHALAPLRGDMLRQYMLALVDSDEYDRALQVAQQASMADPQAYESWFCAGLAYQKKHCYADALAAYDQALELQTADAELLTNRAVTLHELGRLSEARADYDAALALKPGDALARFHKGIALLLQGEYAPGWTEYESRLVSEDFPRRPRHYPRWHGGRGAGRTILLYGEQGLGDEIMFSSCVPDLARSGARCVIECNANLRTLFACSFPEATVYAATSDRHVPDAIAALGIEFEVPLGSLGMHYRRRAQDFPRHDGYLKVPPGRAQAWRGRLSQLGPGLKIGISWRGGTYKSRSPMRSIDLAQWLPVFSVPGLQFVSLQYTADAASELAALCSDHGVRVTHWPEAITDYTETAALVSGLDLTVSVCTSIVHLAGALGRPVWVLAPRTPEWRYGQAGETLAWYPSARMFRQRARGSWEEVIARIAAALSQRVRDRGYA